MRLPGDGPAAVRNVPAALSVAWRHLGRAGSKAESVALRAAPRPLARAVQGRAVRRHRPDLAALALAATGDHHAAATLLAGTLDALPPSPRRADPVRRRVGTAALTLHLAAIAERALTGLDADDPHRRYLQALLAADRGRLTEAVALAEQAPGIRSRELARRLRGEIEVLRHGLLTESLTDSAPPVPRPRPVSRVLHVVSNALPEVQAGYTLRTHGIVTAQRAAGLDPHVVSRYGFPVDIGALTARTQVSVDGVPHHRLVPVGRLPLPGRRMQERAVDALARVVESLGPDLLHAHSKHENAQVALLAARRAGLPVVYEVRGFLEETWRSRGGDPESDVYRWSREAETTCMAAADAVVTLAETMRAEIVSRGVDPGRVHVVPNAVPASFTAPLPDRGAARRALGIAPDDAVFGTVTTLNDYEGVDVLVRALTHIDDPAVRLLVVGDGPARSALAALAEPLGDRVLFTGRVPHARVREHLAAFDVFCVPRRATPVTVLVPPLKPVEALAAGLPVLASDLPPLAETVRAGEHGLLAPPEDPAAWAEQIQALRYAPDHARTMGARARDWIAEHRTWATVVDRYQAVYARAAGAGGHADRPTDRSGD